jgi:hypothetical protein
MTPNDLYSRMPVSVDVGIGNLFGCYFNHIAEIDSMVAGDYDYKYGVDHSMFTLVEVRDVFYYNFDGRRFWRLATVWFKNEPVMVIQNAGREGDDHHERFITNADAYKAMLSYIVSLLPVSETTVTAVDPSQDIPNLDSFYDHTLGGYFERW